MEKHERHYNKMHKKYLRLKPTIKPCTCGGSIGMNEVRNQIWKKFFVECDQCHYCNISKPTMRMAIRAWNREMNALEKEIARVKHDKK